MTQDEIKTILEEHKKWLQDNRTGTRANLYGANLSGTNLSGTNLSGANLSGAYLREADLSGAHLRGAHLYGANLAGANLSGADLSGANLRGVHAVIDMGYPDGWAARAYLYDGTIMVRVACRTKTLAEGRAYWAGKEDRREVMVALNYAEAIAKSRGWEVK